jgi:hypothetical protein
MFSDHRRLSRMRFLNTRGPTARSPLGCREAMRPTNATVVALLLATALAGCGGGGKPAATPAATASPAPSAVATASATAAAPKVAIAAGEQPACALLYARLQRVTSAISSGSELISQSANPTELSHNIEVQQQQLERSAQLMTGGPVPAALAASARELVADLHAYARDFARAQAPASSGDFQAASDAMTDAPLVKRIGAAAQKIQDACKP